MLDDYKKLIELQNIFLAWKKFSSGKSNREDVVCFWRNVEDNIFEIYHELSNGLYKHSGYEQFIVQDNKKRVIHKTCVKDRIVHQLVFDYLNDIYDKKFIYDSYSSRVDKGTHRAVKRLQLFCNQVYGNNSKSCWILKCDIKKFFDSVDHNILYSIIKKNVQDKFILQLIDNIINSYEVDKGKGLPLGNLTSQIFANTYLGEFDYFVKHYLKIKCYIRFSDDFVVISDDKKYLKEINKIFQKFLYSTLKLTLPDEKISLHKFKQGIDFLGYIVLSDIILLRTKTRKRLLKKMKKEIINYNQNNISYTKLCQMSSSYLGLINICKSFKLKQEILFIMTKN